MIDPELRRQDSLSRLFVTRKRMAEDAQGVTILLYIISIIAARNGPEVGVVVLAGAAAVVLIRRAVHWFTRRVFPTHVQSRLPDGPLDAEQTPGAPHSYSDLVQMWFDPDFRCRHKPNVAAPRVAPARLAAIPALSLYALAAAAVTAAIKLANPRAVLAVVVLLTAQVCLIVLWLRALGRRSFDDPAAADVFIGSLVPITIVVIALILRAT